MARTAKKEETVEVESFNPYNEMVYSVPQVAKILHVGPNYVYKLINGGYLKALKLKSLRITRASLERFFEQYEDVDLSEIE
jgi:excisionase family DNA binding protein